jgi:hypothetical protein
MWEISAEAVEWKNGKVYPAGLNTGSFEPLDLADIAARSAQAWRTHQPAPPRKIVGPLRSLGDSAS